MREFIKIEEQNGRKFMRMGVNESRELSRRIIYREILDEDGNNQRDVTPWDRIIFCLRRSSAEHMEFHEKWMAFLQTPSWVHYLRSEFLDDWLYFPIKESHSTPSALGKRIGEWYGKCRFALELIESEPEFARELVSAGLEPLDEGEWLEDELTQIVIDNSEVVIKHRAAVVGRCAKLASLGSFEDASAYFSGFANGLRNSRKAIEEKSIEMDKERQFVSTILCDEWEKVMRMASRSEARDFVASRMPARMRGALNSGKQGPLAFHERMLSLFKQSGLQLAKRGKPSQNGSGAD